MDTKISIHPSSKLKRAYDDESAGFDLYVSGDHNVEKQSTALIPTKDYIVQTGGRKVWWLVNARWSTLSVSGLVVLSNVLDYGYVGIISLNVVNFGKQNIFIKDGMRLAQAIPVRMERVTVKKDLDVPLMKKMINKFKRGDKGCGSTNASSQN